MKVAYAYEFDAADPMVHIGRYALISQPPVHSKNLQACPRNRIARVHCAPVQLPPSRGKSPATRDVLP